ncbi:MAG TPA: PEGA domain-containing protein [Polyangiaceae bacterium]|nr:PEGA domain-containing protein [Polyangiaceae bacterium]
MLRSSSFQHVLAFSVAFGVAELSLIAVPGAALAQTSASDTARVTQLFKGGKAAFARNDMAEAERLFAEAFALRKSSDIAANLGQSELEQQKYRASAEHFQWALINLLPSASDTQRKAVETGLARSRAEVGVLRLDIKPEGSDVLVGEQNLGKTPIIGDVYVDPGEVIVSVKHDGFVALDKRVMVGKGTEQAVEIGLVPKDETPPPASGIDSTNAPKPASSASPSDHVTSKKSLVPAFVATGVAVAGGVVGLVFTLDANSKADKADQLRDDLNAEGGCGDRGTAPSERCSDLSSKRKSVDTSRNIAIGAFVVGGVAALTAGYLYWDALAHSGQESASARNRRARRSVALTPSVNLERGADGRRTPESFKLTLSGTF